MSLIQRGDLVEKLRRTFNILGGGGVQTLSDELVPVVLVDDVTGPDVLSTDYPRNCIGGNQVSAVATKYSLAAFNNPLGSGVDAYLDFAVVSVPSATVVQLRLADHSAWTAGTKYWTDLRVAGSPSCNPTGFAELVIPGDLVAIYRVIANTPTIIPLGMVLQPHGNNSPTYWKAKDVVILSQTVNQDIAVTWYWTERRQEGQV